MSFLTKVKNIFKSTPPATTTPARKIARERLSVILASQRNSEFLERLNTKELQAEVLEVVRRHMKIAEHRPPTFQMRQEGDVSLFEMQVELKERETS